MIECTKCGVSKLRDQFHVKSASSSGRESQCRDCRNEYARAWRSTAHGSKTSYSSKIKKRYGVSCEEYDKMYSDQDGRCGICGIHQSELKRRMCVDHDHETSDVRGLLCNNCNRAIGFLMDSVKNAGCAYEYLLSHKKMAGGVELPQD